jgi:hypothetical protein
MRATSLDHNRAREIAGSAQAHGAHAGLSPDLVLGASGAGTKQPTSNVAGWGAAHFRPRLIRFYAVTGFFLLGVAELESSLAAKEGARRLVDLSAAFPTAVHTTTDRPERDGHSPRALHRRSHKHLRARPDSALAGDAGNDDSDDDDDTTNDLSVNDDSDVPDIAWCQELLCYLIDLEASSNSPSPETPSTPFPGYQRLRC